MEQIICYCKKISKAEIGKAIMNGAKTLADIQKSTTACTGNECSVMNPSGKCCSKEINEMLNQETRKDSNTCCCCK